MPLSDRRPCSQCKRWFTKDARVRHRQHVCGQPECVASRNREACATWRRENPEKVIAARLLRILPKTPPDPPEAVLLDPMRHFSPEAVRHVMGLKETVVLVELAKVLICLARHERPPKVTVKGDIAPKVLPKPARRETARERAPP